VLEELKWDSRVDETEVGVEVDKGVVTLTGTVTGWAKRSAAEEAARRVIGVLDVANDIKIKVPGALTRTDTEIAQAVRHEKITSTVSDGWVTVDGTVDNWSQRGDAERAIRNLTGVKGVVNRITVTPLKPMTEDIRKAIEQVLERRAEREAKRIHVDVRDGVATLTGSALGTGGVEAGGRWRHHDRCGDHNRGAGRASRRHRHRGRRDAALRQGARSR
jgi:osmotically-inducible protein OsmY